ncbi:MAG: hypothetical protein KJ799_13200 [Bacteroidetes bacterium]|nr:hypothetical protein [Bacteroidota bacterium]MBU1681000.1 hypothetical protein [Bacteroidota bacterium]MBU2507662.1 hypothetical protein [Bacteroidota bacterium]
MYFSTRIVLEDIQNNQIKIWRLHEYFQSNGKNDGILNSYTGIPLTNDTGVKPNIKKNDRTVQNLYVKDKYGNHIINNVNPPQAPNAPITVTVSGYIYYEDSNGNTKPLPYAEVAVWEDDGNMAYSAFEWVELTSSTGHFSITVTHDDGDADLELFLRVKSINSWMSVELYQDFYVGNGLAVLGDAPFSWTGITQNNITTNTTINLIIDDYRKGAAQIFDWLMTSTIFTRTAFDPGQVQAVWPGPGSNAYSDPNYNSNLVIGDLNDNADYPDVVFHEFGHTTMYRRNSYHAPNSGGSHSFLGLYSTGLAWSEGWATAYSQFIMNDGYYNAVNFAPTRPHIENAKLGYGDGVYFYPDNLTNSHNEVWAAAVLLDFYDYSEPDNGDDLASRIISFTEMMSIIQNNNIGSIIEFYNLIINGSYLTQIEKNYASRVLIYNKFDVDLILPPIPSTPTISMSGSWSWGDNPTLSFSGGGSFLDHYVLKKEYDFGSGFGASYVNPASNPYTDNNVMITKFGDLTARYSVQVVDIYDQSSAYSNTVSTMGQSLWKNNDEQNGNEIIKEYALDSNYPNPFNPTTQISYQIPKNSFVSLIIYNALGQEVAELVNQHQTSGKYALEFNAKNLPKRKYNQQIMCLEAHIFQLALSSASLEKSNPSNSSLPSPPSLPRYCGAKTT